MLLQMKRLWYDPSGENDPIFRTGEAWMVSPSPDRPWHEHFAQLPLSANTYCGVFHFGIIDKLEHLPTERLPIGAYEEGVLLPAGVGEAAQILRASAAALKQETCDVKVSTRWTPERLELWMTIDVQALREALVDLATFIEEGARNGYTVQLWL
jgi:hypothetical protein